VSFLERFGLRYPIIQAGMGGGIAGGRLAGAVSAAGALGTVGILPPREMADELARAREIAAATATASATKTAAATAAPVAANLLVPFARRAHVDACRRAGTPIVVLHGGFDRRLTAELRQNNAFVFQTVGTPEQARRALAEGADGLIVQGREAGGHLIGVEPALAALTRIRDATGAARTAGTAGTDGAARTAGAAGTAATAPNDVPVLLAGGIADAADVKRALDAGADAVVAGTRFLLTDESAAHADYKRRVLAAERTIETQLFGLGWPMRHRVVPNAATDRWCKLHESGPDLLRAAYRLTTPLQRVPLSMASRLIALQHPAVPLFGPSAALDSTPDRLLDASALYAGETALRIDSIVPAAEAVALLAGTSAASETGSPTIRSS
jgi:NAD(P)H-dependent flavin oxidoreductase YrpB (nitropropane dioxygenase family)